MDADAPPPILLPCAICARTFMPQSLEKHARICERAAVKKRKPFDSAKQRVQGTELAEFLPKEARRHHQDERTTRSSWKKTHDDFLRAIREARGDTMDSHRQCNSLISSGAPTRANEKGTCPTCNRQFGIKAYDRHVAWCKDRVTRMPVSLATNLAKERLEARMRYRAPALKNRRAINREKYSPGSAANQAAKTTMSSPALVKSKESTMSVNSNRESPVKQKSTIVKRPVQLKENSLTSSGPMKSRLADRMNGPEEDSLLASTSCRSFHPATSFHRPLHFPVPPARPGINNPISSNEITSPVASSRKQFDRNETISQRIRNDDTRNRETCSARIQKNIVFTRSQGHPRINDITVNDRTLGMTVHPCRIYTDMQKDDQLVTWKQISCKNDTHHANNLVDNNFSPEFQLLDLDRLYDREEGNEIKNSLEEDSSIAENNRIDDKSSDGEIDKMKNDDVTWLDGIQNLNQTYLIRDSEDIEPSEIFHKWKSIKNSPRVEFYLKDKEVEICEFDQKESRRETVVNEEEINIEQMKELKVSIKNEEDDETVVSYKIKKLKKNDKNIGNNRKMNSEEIGEIARITEDINSKDEENKPRASYEEIKDTECNIEKIEKNIEDTKETEKIDCADVSVSNKLNVYKENEENQQIAMDKRIIESMKYTEESKRNLSEPGDIIKSSSLDAMHSVEWNVSKKKNFIDQNQDLNFKDEILRESSMCCNNSLEFKESIVTLISDQSNINETISLNNNNNQANCNSSPENETLVCQSNSCRNSLDLKENIKEKTFPASCRSINPEKNYGRNDEENYNNGLSNIHNKKSKRNSKRLHHEVESLPRNSKIAADNYLNAPMNNISVHIKDYRQHQKGFSSDNFENIENNTRDFNIDSDNNSCSNDKLKLPGRSIIKTEVTTGEGLRKKYIDSEFDYGSDNTARVGECNARGTNGLGSSIMLTDYVEEESRCYGNEIFLNASANFPRRAASVAKKIAQSVNSVEMKRRIRENMNLLRGSTDSLISSVEFVELASIRRPEANCAYERETIEIIRPSRQNKVFKDLPDVKNDAAETREDSERSYWEKASKISRSRLTSLYPACHAKYKFPKRIPRVRILPPVLNPLLINRR